MYVFLKLGCNVTNVIRMEEKRNAFKHLAENPEGNMPLGRLWTRFENNGQVDLKLGSGCLNWIHLAQDRDPWQ
jgi:hypothetical protein